MPIDYRDYPVDWGERRARVLVRAGNACETCRRPNGKQVFVFKNGWWTDGYCWLIDDTGNIVNGDEPVDEPRLVETVLTIAHLDRTTGDPAQDGPLDCADDRLAALCQRCHLRLDRARHTAKAAAATRSATQERKRQQKQEASGVIALAL